MSAIGSVSNSSNVYRPGTISKPAASKQAAAASKAAEEQAETIAQEQAETASGKVDIEA